MVISNSEFVNAWNKILDKKSYSYKVHEHSIWTGEEMSKTMTFDEVIKVSYDLGISFMLEKYHQIFSARLRKYNIDLAKPTDPDDFIFRP